MFLANKKLTSGSIWVNEVVRITPPPKQDKAEMKICPLVRFPPGVRFLGEFPKLQHSLINSGTRPISSERPPSRNMAAIFAVNTSILWIFFPNTGDYFLVVGRVTRQGNWENDLSTINWELFPQNTAQLAQHYWILLAGQDRVLLRLSLTWVYFGLGTVRKSRFF